MAPRLCMRLELLHYGHSKLSGTHLDIDVTALGKKAVKRLACPHRTGAEAEKFAMAYTSACLCSYLLSNDTATISDFQQKFDDESRKRFRKRLPKCIAMTNPLPPSLCITLRLRCAANFRELAGFCTKTHTERLQRSDRPCLDSIGSFCVSSQQEMLLSRSALASSPARVASAAQSLRPVVHTHQSHAIRYPSVVYFARLLLHMLHAEPTAVGSDDSG